MAREWRRLLVPPERLAAAAAPGDRAGAELALEPPELHYLRRVLRLRPGQRFALVDGAGHLWSASLGAATAQLEQPLQRPLLSEPQPRPALRLAVALPRQDADVLLRMACELGIDRLSPLAAERSAAAAPLRPERQAAILREALEQCERLWLPRLDAPRPATAALAAAPEPGGQEPAPGGPVLRLLATTRREGLPPLEQRLMEAAASSAGLAEELPPGQVVVAIGPEGGWSPAEEEAAAAAGWQPVALGATILRTSTAAVAAATLLAAWRRGLAISCGTSRSPSP
ncbi:MAG: 16S rRNA (uracil(1498)-N(3))-methyltransferase [Prochlorococcaceae cyanobacterium]